MEAASNLTNVIFHGLLYENENDSNGIHTILKELHKFLPHTEGKIDQLFADQAVVGDQISVERAVNCLLQISNGYTTEDRLEGLHFEVGDFHSGMKFVQLAYDNFYSGCSADSPCTMFNDAALINHRNIGSDVKSRISPSKEFLFLELIGRVTAATLEELGLQDIDDSLLPANDFSVRSEDTEKRFLYDLASKVVDNYIIHKDQMEALLNFTKDELDSSARETLTGDGRYICRFPGCTKSFKLDGKGRKDHEASHTESNKMVEKKVASSEYDDDLYNFQSSFLELSMLIFNFYDAISMSDENRSRWCSSKKYALEGLYLMCQCYALLSERGARNYRWNRFIKKHRGIGGNIPLDLAMEHYNHMLKNIVHMLGPNVSIRNAISRYCKALVVNAKLIDNWDCSLKLFHPSGKHKFPMEDLKKTVKKLMENHALEKHKGRRLKCKSRIHYNLLDDLDMRILYKWINSHKKHITTQKAGR
eukprot:gene8514-9427_t